MNDIETLRYFGLLISSIFIATLIYRIAKKCCDLFEGA